jgi:hypothetical protein
VPSGLTASVEPGTAVFGRCNLRAEVTRFLDGLLASLCGGFSGAITGVASGKSSATTPRPLGNFSNSTQRKNASLSSSIAAHPARPKLADTVNNTSATRAQACVDVLMIRRVRGSLVGLWGGREAGIVWLPCG